MKFSRVIILLLLRAGLMFVASGSALTARAGTLDYTPYAQANSNRLYNQLFCDNPTSYKNTNDTGAKRIWQMLLSDTPDIQAIQKLSRSTELDSRQKLLAYHILKQHKLKPGHKVLLGVIVEVAFGQGMDTLAAYRDGSVYYIHRGGQVKILKVPNAAIAGKVKKLFQESQPVIEKIRPWPHQRLAPPGPEQVRISFLVSDGIYFGQGSMKQLELNPLAGPVLTAATELLIQLVKH